jgi:hypothetical protein
LAIWFFVEDFGEEVDYGNAQSQQGAGMYMVDQAQSFSRNDAAWMGNNRREQLQSERRG